MVALALLLQAGGARAASAEGTVLAVLSSDAGPYRDHLDGFKAAAEFIIVDYTLRESDNEEKIAELVSENAPVLVLAVGTRAAEMLAAIELDVPLLVTMVYYPPPGLESRATVLTLRAPPAMTVGSIGYVKPADIDKLTVGLIYSDSVALREIAEIESALADAGHRLVATRIESEGEIGAVLDSYRGGVDALWLIPDKTVLPDAAQLRYLLERAMSLKIMVVGLSPAHARMGAAIALSADYRLEGGHAAEMAQELAEGRGGPGEVLPENVVRSLNTRVCDEIGWPVPTMTRKRFGRVYP